VILIGRSESNFAKDPDTRRSLSGKSVFLCGAPGAGSGIVCCDKPRAGYDVCMSNRLWNLSN
jgi:hypothetical protein